MKKELLFDRCLTGRLPQGIETLPNAHEIKWLCNSTLFDRCLTGQPPAEAVEKRIMGLLREVTE